MAFPVVESRNNSQSSGNVTTHPVDMPSGIQVDDLLIMVIGVDGDGSSAAVVTWPSGWSEIFQTAHSADTHSHSAAYKVADGGEGATEDFTTDDSETSVHLTFRISGYTGTPEAGTSVEGDSDSPDPPSLAPSWGADDTLWIACQGNDGQTYAEGFPTDYSEGRAEY